MLGRRRPDAIDADSREAYRRASTAPTIAAMCADYRASFHLDRQHDADDRAAGRRIAAPVLVVVGEDETQPADAREVWRAWAQDLIAGNGTRRSLHPRRGTPELASMLAGFLAPAQAVDASRGV